MATFYVDPTAANDNGDGSSGSPKKYLQSAVNLLTAGDGDTLILRDGTYSNSLDDLNNLMPKGTAGNYTIIKAENDGAAIITANRFRYDFTNTPQYTQWEGILWIFPRGHSLDGNFCKFFRCGWRDGEVAPFIVNGNVSQFGMGSNNRQPSHTYGPVTSDCLFEDCWFFGDGGRYAPIAFNAARIIFRRCISRLEPTWVFNEGSGQGPPMSGMCAYSSEDIIYQNCISLDGRINADGFWSGNFYLNNNDSNLRLTRIAYEGCLSIGSERGAFYVEGNTDTGQLLGTITMNNTVAINASWGFHMSGPGIDSMVYTNCLTANHGTGIFKTGPAPINGSGIDCIVAGCTKDLSDADLSNAFTHTYFAKSGNTENNLTSETGDQTYDVFTNGLLYPVRLEAGSNLAGDGSTAAGIGPTILKKIGVSGTLFGETGWNTVTSDDLWPFPNEDRIKTEFSAVNNSMGFTLAGAKQLDGVTDVTVTSYVWEILGNQMPSSVYGSTPAVVQHTRNVPGGAGRKWPGFTAKASSGVSRPSGGDYTRNVPGGPGRRGLAFSAKAPSIGGGHPAGPYTFNHVGGAGVRYNFLPKTAQDIIITPPPPAKETATAGRGSGPIRPFHDHYQDQLMEAEEAEELIHIQNEQDILNLIILSVTQGLL